MAKKKSNAILGCLILVLMATGIGIQLVKQNTLVGIVAMTGVLLLGAVAIVNQSLSRKKSKAAMRQF